MSYLTTLHPALARVRQLPLTRDQVMLLMMATNEIFLGIDTYLAHNISGTVRPYEWIPILFGPIAGVILLGVGLLALRQRTLANTLATVIFALSIVVGLLGAFFHLNRAVLPAGPSGQQVVLDLFFWAPPVLGPLAFVLVGVMGISAAWVESPVDSGLLRLPGGLRLQLPYPKTHAYFYMVSLGILIALISSVLDHARTGFANPWLWLPVGAGVFAAVVAGWMGALEKAQRGDVWVYALAMLLLMAVGLTGALLHVVTDLTTTTLFIPERFLRGAPFLAPMLFANMGMLGLGVLLDAKEE